VIRIADSTDQALLLLCVLEGPVRSGDDDNPAAAKRRRLRQELIGETHPLAADAATNEIDHNLSLGVPAEFEGDPLRFWEKHQSSFPILSVVARVYIRMSATSVPVECMFSTTGVISNGRRSSIGPAKQNRSLFIHDNFAFVTSDN